MSPSPSSPPSASVPPAPAGPLAQTAARGATVTIVGQGLRLTIQLLAIVVLARLLAPSDYGLVAMVTVVVSFGEIFRDFGLSAAAIQSPQLSTAQRSNLFWANTVLGAVLGGVAFALAEPLAAFYNEPDVTAVARTMAVIFILNGLSAQYRAGLTRQMRFTRLATAEVVAQAAGFATGLTAALNGWGYWSLVAMQVAQALAALLLLVGFARWVPGRPRTGQGMGRFWKYGGNLMGSQVLAFAGSNVDSLVIGRRLGADALGIYDRAYRLLMVPLAQIKMPATTVALPVLSRLQADRDRYDEYLCRAQLVLGYSVMPALAVVVGASGPLTDVLLGPQWTQSAPILALLAVAGGLNTIAFVAYWVYLSRSLTHRLLQYTAVSAAVKVLFIVVGSNWGLIGVAAGAAAAPAVLWLVSYWWLSRLTDLPLRRLVSGAVRILIGAGLAALAAAAAVSAVQDVAGAVVQIGCAALAVAGGYLVLTVLFRAYRRDVADVREVAVMMVSRKRHVG